MIAIPDFSAGAMENWGLITYRETALLYKPGNIHFDNTVIICLQLVLFCEGVSSRSNKQRVAIVISHELAHQWFGNLVSGNFLGLNYNTINLLTISGDPLLVDRSLAK